MRIGILFILLFTIASCTESVLDPSELGNGGIGGSGYPIYFNTESSTGVRDFNKIFTATKEIVQIARSSFITSPPVGNKMVYIESSDPLNQKVILCDLNGSNSLIIATGQNIESAALSPDGSMVIYTELYDNGGITYCHLMSAATSNPFIATTIDDLADPAVMPTFSPDGKYIAYSRLDISGLDTLVIYSILNPASSYEYPIIANSFTMDLEFDWMPDGRSVVCLVNDDVAIVSIESGIPTFLNFASAFRIFPLFPVTSSDGKIAVVGYDPLSLTNSSDIYEYANGSWSNVTNSYTTSELLPHYSADGKKMLYSALDTMPVGIYPIPESSLMLYENGTVTKLMQGNIVRPLFGR